MLSHLFVQTGFPLWCSPWCCRRWRWSNQISPCEVIKILFFYLNLCVTTSSSLWWMLFVVIQFFSKIFVKIHVLYDFDRWGVWNQPKSITLWKYFFIFSLSLATEKSFLCVKWNENIFKLSFFYFLAICQNWINHGNITRIVPWIYDYYFLKINWPQNKYNPGFYRLRVKAQIPESKMM